MRRNVTTLRPTVLYFASIMFVLFVQFIIAPAISQISSQTVIEAPAGSLKEKPVEKITGVDAAKEQPIAETAEIDTTETEPETTEGETKPAPENSDETVNSDQPEEPVETNTTETPLKPIEKERKPAQTQLEPPVQFQWTPEDPSFLYETRYLPGQAMEEEFLTIEQEKEVAEQAIEEEKNFRESLKKIDFKLPDPGKAAIVLGILILFIFYRIRIKKIRKNSGNRL